MGQTQNARSGMKSLVIKTEDDGGRKDYHLLRRRKVEINKTSSFLFYVWMYHIRSFPYADWPRFARQTVVELQAFNLV
jgi:hypothetical protein